MDVCQSFNNQLHESFSLDIRANIRDWPKKKKRIGLVVERMKFNFFSFSFTDQFIYLEGWKARLFSFVQRARWRGFQHGFVWNERILGKPRDNTCNNYSYGSSSARNDWTEERPSGNIKLRRWNEGLRSFSLDSCRIHSSLCM